MLLGHGVDAVGLAEDPGDQVDAGIARTLDPLAHEPPRVVVQLLVAASPRRRIVAAPLLGVEELLRDRPSATTHSSSGSPSQRQSVRAGSG